MPKEKEETKDKLLTVKVTDRFANRLAGAARVLDRSASQIVREATDKELERLAKRNPAVREAIEAAAA